MKIVWTPHSPNWLPREEGGGQQKNFFSMPMGQARGKMHLQRRDNDHGDRRRGKVALNDAANTSLVGVSKEAFQQMRNAAARFEPQSSQASIRLTDEIAKKRMDRFGCLVGENITVAVDSATLKAREAKFGKLASQDGRSGVVVDTATLKAREARFGRCLDIMEDDGRNASRFSASAASCVVDEATLKAREAKFGPTTATGASAAVITDATLQKRMERFGKAL